MYKGSYEDLKRLKRMKKENFLYAAIIIGSIDQVENVLEGDEMDMCEGMERMAEGFRSEGREEGILVGRVEGKLEEKQNMLKEQLGIKFGSLSSNLTNQLSKASIEKLNVLTRHIFNVTNEEDVLKIIN